VHLFRPSLGFLVEAQPSICYGKSAKRVNVHIHRLMCTLTSSVRKLSLKCTLTGKGVQCPSTSGKYLFHYLVNLNRLQQVRG
jgi:hypothetical protein